MSRSRYARLTVAAGVLLAGVVSVVPVGTAAADVGGPAVTCVGDGQSGKRVQLIYVHSTSGPDNYDAKLAEFRQHADQIDQMFLEASGRTGGVRHVRFVHDANCLPAVAKVGMSEAAMAPDPGPQPPGRSTAAKVVDAMPGLGHNSTDRKYVIFYDKPGCGGASGAGGNDSPGPGNGYNSGPGYAAMGSGCWSWHAAGHELLHTLGAVQASAPHATGGSHCWDDEDIMCYDDGHIPNPPGQLTQACPGAPNNQIDCDNDDYFHTNPAPGSYLATHWNIANSQYLDAATPVGRISGALSKCIDVWASGTANGTSIVLFPCNGTGAQQWTMPGDGSMRALGKCLDVQWSGTANGALTHLWDCNGSAAQVWKPQLDGTLRNPNSGRCLDTQNRSTNDGTRLVIFDCASPAVATEVWNVP